MSSEPVVFSRKNPFPAPLRVNRKLTGEGSNKDTRHFEFDLDGSGLVYECGDSIGIFPKNDPELVEEILHALDATGEEPVAGNRRGAEAAARGADRGLPDHPALHAIHPGHRGTGRRGGGVAAGTARSAAQEHNLDEYLWGMEYIDFLLAHPSIHFTPEEFVKLLRKLQPRLYSIASSQKAHPEAVHLTIARSAVSFARAAAQRRGLHLHCRACRRNGAGAGIRPHGQGIPPAEDGNTPIIMVGPGTGVAPFRAYLQDRKATGAKGEELALLWRAAAGMSISFTRTNSTALQAEGILTRLDTAFSRDQAHKIYVQNRMIENRGGDLEMDRPGRGALLRLRRRGADGEGRGRGAA